MQCEGLTCLLGDCQVAFLEILQVFLSFTRSTFDHSCKELPQIGRNIQLFESIKSQCGRGGGEFVVQSYRTFLQSHKQGRNNPINREYNGASDGCDGAQVGFLQC